MIFCFIFYTYMSILNLNHFWNNDSFKNACHLAKCNRLFNGVCHNVWIFFFFFLVYLILLMSFTSNQTVKFRILFSKLIEWCNIVTGRQFAKSYLFRFRQSHLLGSSKQIRHRIQILEVLGKLQIRIILCIYWVYICPWKDF